MKLLVTDGAGHVGSILVPGLPSEGNEVIVIDNYMYSEQLSFNCDYNNMVCDDTSNR